MIIIIHQYNKFQGSHKLSTTVCAASYLPRPSDVEYQFVYVDKMGKVCSRSRPFIFCAPKPLEELETLKEEQDEEDGEEELMLVIPRAQLLQVMERTHTHTNIHMQIPIFTEITKKQWKHFNISLWML